MSWLSSWQTPDAMYTGTADAIAAELASRAALASSTPAGVAPSDRGTRPRAHEARSTRREARLRGRYWLTTADDRLRVQVAGVSAAADEADTFSAYLGRAGGATSGEPCGLMPGVACALRRRAEDRASRARGST